MRLAKRRQAGIRRRDDTAPRRSGLGSPRRPGDLPDAPSIFIDTRASLSSPSQFSPVSAALEIFPHVDDNERRDARSNVRIHRRAVAGDTAGGEFCFHGERRRRYVLRLQDENHG